MQPVLDNDCGIIYSLPSSLGVIRYLKHEKSRFQMTSLNLDIKFPKSIPSKKDESFAKKSKITKI